MYKNIIFDFGGVLVSYYPRVFLVDHFMNEALENELYDITFGSEEWRRLDEGVMTRAEANRIMREKGAAIGRRFEVDTILTDWTDMLRTKEDTARLVRRLKKNGYKTFYLSNIPQDVLDQLRQRHFYSLLDGGIASCEAHLAKPDVRIYQLLLQTYGLAASECVFFDDNPENAEAAGDAGITGIAFRTASQAAHELTARGVRLER